MYRKLIVLVALLALSSCGGNKTPGPIVINGQDAVLKSLAAGDAGKATLRGTVTIEGLTASGPVGAPTGSTVLGKIFDPEDDILSASIPITPGTQFESKLDAAFAGAFEIDTTVAEDINGDGTTPDTLTIAVPVNLPAGRVSSITLAVRKGVKPTGPPTSSEPGTAEDQFYPQVAGELLLIDLTLSDASGSKTAFYALTPGGSVVFDADGDRFIEAGDDTIYADANHNGWPDTSEAAFKSSAATALTLNGTVSAVDRVARTLRLRDSAGTLTDVAVDPFASLTPVTAEGTLLGSLLLDQTLVGREVQLYGMKNGAESRGSLVVVLPIDSKTSAK